MINSDPDEIKSVRQLKEIVAEIDDDYWSDRQQDAGEFLSYLISKCSVLQRLTHFSVHTTFQCIICKESTNKIDEMNIRYENLNSDSIADILTFDKRVPLISKNCSHCQRDTSHAELQSLYELPEVLIISLKRFTQNGEEIKKNSHEVEPSYLLQFDEAVYSLNAVVSHFGPNANQGHYITSLFRNNEWVYCNDEIVSEPKNDVPKMGYLFVYDKVNQISLPPPSISNNTLNEQDASTGFVNKQVHNTSRARLQTGVQADKEHN